METRQGQTVVYLKKIGFSSWAILSAKGHVMRESFYASNLDMALRFANNWASSFTGWIVELHDETKRD